MRSIQTILATILIAIPVLCQTPESKRPSFEVATIKPSEPGQQRRTGIFTQPGGRLLIRGVPVRMMLTYAYRLRDFQISGGPNWIDTDLWDIEARAEENSISSAAPFFSDKPDPMGIRLQSLLEDRFHLRVHPATKELPIYELTIMKSGSKMKLSGDQTPIQMPERGAPPAQPPQGAATLPRGGVRRGPGNLAASGVPTQIFVQVLSQLVGRTVIDKTELQGLYDISLEWTPANLTPAGPAGIEAGPAIDPNGLSIFTALQEQLGLKLDSAKGPVDVIVIDSIQKPSEN